MTETSRPMTRTALNLFANEVGQNIVGNLLIWTHFICPHPLHDRGLSVDDTPWSVDPSQHCELRVPWIVRICDIVKQRNRERVLRGGVEPRFRELFNRRRGGVTLHLYRAAFEEPMPHVQRSVPRPLCDAFLRKDRESSGLDFLVCRVGVTVR